MSKHLFFLWFGWPEILGTGCFLATSSSDFYPPVVPYFFYSFVSSLLLESPLQKISSSLSVCWFWEDSWLGLYPTPTHITTNWNTWSLEIHKITGRSWRYFWGIASSIPHPATEQVLVENKRAHLLSRMIDIFEDGLRNGSHFFLSAFWLCGSSRIPISWEKKHHDTVDGCEILHHQKDGWNSINHAING